MLTLSIWLALEPEQMSWSAIRLSTSGRKWERKKRMKGSEKRGQRKERRGDERKSGTVGGVMRRRKEEDEANAGIEDKGK